MWKGQKKIEARQWMVDKVTRELLSKMHILEYLESYKRTSMSVDMDSASGNVL